MKTALILIADQIIGLIAPFVTIFYREGWFNTPDDPVSPRGMGEPFMRKLHAKVGPWLADWWWLGWRNRGYGFTYAMKPDVFKGLHYKTIPPGQSTNKVCWFGPFLARRITILGYTERCFTLIAFGRGLFTVIVGYRLRPIWDEIWRNAGKKEWDVPTRPVNMDARPILSIRFGYDD
jgi:hypothetical protein